MGSLFHDDNEDMAIKKELNTLLFYFDDIAQETQKYLRYFLKAHRYNPTYLAKPYDMYWNGIGLMYDAIYDLRDDARETHKLSHFLRSFGSMIFHSKVHIAQAQADLIEQTIVLLYQLQWMLKNVKSDILQVQKNQSQLSSLELFSYCSEFKNAIPKVLKEIKEAEDILQLRGFGHFFKFFKAQKNVHDIENEKEVDFTIPKSHPRMVYK